MEPEEFLSLTNLFKAETLCFHELLKVVMINKYKNLIFAYFQIVALSFKDLNNSKKLRIVGFVACLS